MLPIPVGLSHPSHPSPWKCHLHPPTVGEALHTSLRQTSTVPPFRSDLQPLSEPQGRE